MQDASDRLMDILRGRRVDRPPLWDPWFAMGRFLNERYGGDYLAMAEDLDHAAVPVGIVRTTVDCFDDQYRHSAGRGQMRHARQGANDPDPYWAIQAEQARAGRDACRAAGRACWMTMKWSFDAIVNAMGYEEFALTCYDDASRLVEVIECMEHRNQVAVEHVIAEVKPDFVLFEANCAYQSGPMIDPTLMRQMCEAPTRQTLHRLADAGVPAVFHTEGKVDELLPLIIDMGFMGLQGCDPQANDLGDLVGRFGDRIALCGNLDIALLAGGSPETVSEATRRMLAAGSRKGRFAAGANTVVQDDTPIENYLAMVKAVAAFGKEVVA